MAKRISKIKKSLRDLGQTQINDWEVVPAVLNKEIKELEIARSLRRLGQIRVTEWNFKDVIPAVTRIAQTEVDVFGIIKRTADYKIIDWELPNFKNDVASSDEDIIHRLERFLEYMIQQLIDQPRYASIHVERLSDHVICLKAVMLKSDASMLIGLNGNTSNPIRHLLKMAGETHGMQVLLKIQSHEEATRELVNSK